MKKVSAKTLGLIAVLCPLTLVFFCAYGCGGDDENPPDLSVHFSDSNLEAAVREAIDKPSGPIYPWDLDGLNMLSAPDSNIESLGGIQYCTDLTDLDLSGNIISNIKPLKGLTRLSVLNLTQNSISDIGPLGDLTNLTTLKLGDNVIGDITAVQDLTRLNLLELQRNRIVDIGPLQGLTGLTLLNLGTNRIGTDVSEEKPPSAVLLPLQGLLNLGSLDLGDNSIEDIHGLVINSNTPGGLGTGDSVILVNNPLSSTALSEIQLLEDNGVQVFY